MANLELLNQKTMSSREIAELTGKPHNDVLKAIRAMEPAWVKVNGGNFSLVEYKDSKGEKRPMYELSKTECLYVATKFNDEARAKLVIRWQELELKENTPKFKIPQTYSEALRELADKTDENEKLKMIAVANAPKVLFADAIVASDNSVLIGKLANVLKQNGIDIGQNRLFKWLRENGYLCKYGERYNQPTQKSMELELFEVSYNTVVRADKSIQTITTKVTGKGQVYFINKFLDQKDIA